MKIYHGSNMEVAKPKIKEKLRALDFGAGFYLTSSRIQAEKWARIVAKRRREGQPIINIYELDENKYGQLNVLKFESANGEWLDFVVANRKEMFIVEKKDVVVGPVADDSTLPVIDDYMDGKYTKEQAVERLMPQNLTDQYAFLTETALEALHFEGREVL